MVNMTSSQAFYTCYNQKIRIHELENVIAIDPWYSYCYANNIIKGRWEEGEKSIATNSGYSFWYARDVIKGRFIEGEKTIATNPESSYLYARDIIKGHFELCHHIIFNSEYKDGYVNFLKFINYDISEYGEWLI